MNLSRLQIPLLNFIDEDLSKSAKMLTNKHLDKNIENCFQILICSLLYMVGIRNKKACAYYFCKERKKEYLDRFFPYWPLKESPKFIKYNSQESKWCRKCKNHYDIVLNYFKELLDEYCFRHNHDHKLYEMYDYLSMLPYDISLKLGIKILYVKDLKIVLPWKALPLKYRRKDIVFGHRLYYQHIILDPYAEYEGTNRDIPDFILEYKGLKSNWIPQRVNPMPH